MKYEKKLNLYLHEITGMDKDAAAEAGCRWDSIAKPVDGLGLFESMIEKIAGMQGRHDVSIKPRAVVVMCADNGLVEEGVTQTDSSVTSIVAANMAAGIATVNSMAKVAGADVFPVDIGMKALVNNPDILEYKVDFGTGNIAKGPAMSREQACQAIVSGIEIVRKLSERGYVVFATGEMGIGNTTTTSVIASILTGLPADIVTGRGAGLSEEALAKKYNVVRRAIEINSPDVSDPLDILSKVGGFDIAGMTGIFLGGALCRHPVIIDGAISAAAAVLAKMLCCHCADFMLPSHMGKEPAAPHLMKLLDLEPVIYGEMGLGEGTGAVMLFSLLDMAVNVYNTEVTFSDISVEPYRRFGK